MSAKRGEAEVKSNYKTIDCLRRFRKRQRQLRTLISFLARVNAAIRRARSRVNKAKLTRLAADSIQIAAQELAISLFFWWAHKDSNLGPAD
jgi:hypothetical protein